MIHTYYINLMSSFLVSKNIKISLTLSCLIRDFQRIYLNRIIWDIDKKLLKAYNQFIQIYMERQLCMNGIQLNINETTISEHCMMWNEMKHENDETKDNQEDHWYLEYIDLISLSDSICYSLKHWDVLKITQQNIDLTLLFALNCSFNSLSISFQNLIDLVKLKNSIQDHVSTAWK